MNANQIKLLENCNKFKSIKSTEDFINELGLSNLQIDTNLLQALIGVSPKYAQNFCKAIVRQSISNAENPNLILFLALVKSGCDGKSNSNVRETICIACHKSYMSMLLIHAIAQLDQNNVEVYMKSYFETGGNFDITFEWWKFVRNFPVGQPSAARKNDRKALKILKNHTSQTVSIAVSWNDVEDFFNKVFNPKSWPEFIKNLPKYTFRDTVNFIRDSIEKGSKAISTMLDEAKNESLNALKKIGKAVLSLLKYTKEFIEWLSKDPIETFVNMCQALPGKLLKNIFETIKKNIEKFKSFFEKVVEELLNITTDVGLRILNAILSVWGNFRKLTEEERENAEIIFGNSIKISRVRISKHNVALTAYDAVLKRFRLNAREFVAGYRIYVPSGGNLDMGTLIHELTHIWQYEEYGANYVWNCLISQHFGKRYSVTDQHLVNANGNLKNLECEQQAVVVERYWESDIKGKENWSNENYKLLAKQVYAEEYKPRALGKAVEIIQDRSKAVRPPGVDFVP